MIDVHTLTLPTENQEWLEQCVSSLKDEPVTHHVLKGTDGSVLDGRIRGYDCGSHPYVSFVDSDDYVLPGALQHCLDYLQQNSNVGGVYTNSYQLGRKGKLRPLFKYEEWSLELHLDSGMTIHPLFVVRRDVMAQALENLMTQCDRLEDIKLFPDQLIYANVSCIIPWCFFPNVYGYVWRRLPTGTHCRPNTSKNKKLSGELVNQLITKKLRSAL